jgi:hypothetical protein
MVSKLMESSSENNYIHVSIFVDMKAYKTVSINSFLGRYKERDSCMIQVLS